jgi:hypothetical protein
MMIGREKIPGASSKACPDATEYYRSHSKALGFNPVLGGKKLMTQCVD